MSRFNTDTSHPLIQNSQEYILEKKYISINSGDRDIIKYPNSAEFEIELPQDYYNIQSIELANWAFPSNYNTFSLDNNNTIMTYQIDRPYNPGEFYNNDHLASVIFEAIYNRKELLNYIVIDEGFYTPNQMATEIQNLMNENTTNNIISYINENSSTIKDPDLLLNEFVQNGGYQNFVVVYNSVQQNLWFGNKCDGFIISNQYQPDLSKITNILNCNTADTKINSFQNWGLPYFLGFKRCAAISEASKINTSTGFMNLPRFYYGDALTVGDNGYWLKQAYPPAPVYFLSAPSKINLMGNAYFYMEIDGLNMIDETYPYSLSTFTTTTNITSGQINSSFAKIGVVTTPISQWFDQSGGMQKIYNPPLERLRKLKIKLRYHDGQILNFGNFDFSLMLIFNCFRPQIKKNFNVYNPY